MLNFDIDTAIRQGLTEILAGNDYSYFDIPIEIGEIIDLIIAVMATCQLRAESLDAGGDVAEALTRCNQQKITEIRTLLLKVADNWRNP